MSTLYMDWAASALQDRVILEKSVKAAMADEANPSAQHDMGKKAKAVLEKNRERCASALGCRPGQLLFTSGGSESNNIVFLSRLLERNPGRIAVSSLEHSSVSAPAELLKKKGIPHKLIHPDGKGIVTPEKLLKSLSGETRFVSIMSVHNETGVIQPIRELVSAVRDFEKQNGLRPIHFHSDMVQAAGKRGIDLAALDVDSASFSAHKIRGPKGVGLLYMKKEMPVLYRGGGQERGLRPGTESIQNSEAMASALERWGSPPGEELQRISRILLDGLKDRKGFIHFNPPSRATDSVHYAPQIVNFSMRPLPGEVLQRIMNERGIFISTGSACSSNKKKNTGSLEAMGISRETAHCSVRVSIGPETGEDDLAYFFTQLDDIIKEYIEK